MRFPTLAQEAPPPFSFAGQDASVSTATAEPISGGALIATTTAVVFHIMALKTPGIAVNVS
jgi:hypothetical protein